MARRRKAKRRRSPKKFSIINAVEAYAYANLLTEGLAGTNPVNFITGGSDISYGTATVSGSTAMTIMGAEQLTLTEMITNPGIALAGMQSNFMNNYQSMAVQAIGIGVGFKMAKKLLRKPVNTVNREIFKPLGIGVKL
tara:strand:+ start:557 stop:970 length:414 start_codon:yes stop_codon:yes gene_type:complete